MWIIKYIITDWLKFQFYLSKMFYHKGTVVLLKTYIMCMHCYVFLSRDLQYISIWEYIDTLIEYHIVILCSINIEISKCLIALSGARFMLLI